MKWMIPLTLVYPVTMLLITGYGYFTAYLPTSWSDFLATHNVTSLSAMLWWMTCSALIRALACVLAMLRQEPHCAPKSDVLSYPHAKGTGSGNGQAKARFSLPQTTRSSLRKKIQPRSNPSSGHLPPTGFTSTSSTTSSSLTPPMSLSALHRPADPPQETGTRSHQ